MFNELKMLASQNISSSHEIEHFHKLPTSKKREILKSFRRSTKILPFTQDETVKVTSLPPIDSAVKEFTGKLLYFSDSVLLLNYLSGSFFRIAPPSSSGAAIHKIFRKRYCLKGFDEDTEAEVVIPPSTGMDNLISCHERVKQKKSKSNSDKTGEV